MEHLLFILYQVLIEADICMLTLSYVFLSQGRDEERSQAAEQQMHAKTPLGHHDLLQKGKHPPPKKNQMKNAISVPEICGALGNNATKFPNARTSPFPALGKQDTASSG